MHATPDLHCTGIGGLQPGALWPMRGFCGQHRGIGNFKGSQDGTVNWSVDLGCIIRSSAAVANDGTIYIGEACSERLYALNPNGTIKWSYETNGAVDSSPAIGTDGTVYFGSDDNRVYALDPVTGLPRWTRLTGGDVDSSPAIGNDGTIYIGSDDNKLYALNPANGNVLWTYTTSGDINTSPAIGPNGQIYVGSQDDRLHAVSSTGAFLWKTNLSLDVESSPAVGPAPDHFIYVGSDANKLYKLNPANGAIVWSFTAIFDVDSSPAFQPDGTIVFGDTSGHVWALNPDKTVKWSRDLDLEIDASPSVGADGIVYIGCDDNKVYALHPDDGTVLWSVPTGADVDSSPVIGPLGAIIAGNDDGKLYSIGGTLPVPEGDDSGDLDSGDTTGLQAGALWPVAGGVPTRHGVSAKIGSRITTPNWQVGLGGDIRNAAVIDSAGTAYVGSDSGEVRAVRADGTTKWTVNLGAAVRSTAAIAADGSIYVGADDGKLRKLSGVDGSTTWTFDAGGPIRTSLVVGPAGTIYFGTTGATPAIYAISSAGAPVWSLPAPSDVLASPAIARHGSVVFVRGQELQFFAATSSLDGAGIQVTEVNLGGATGTSSPVMGGGDDVFVGRTDGTLVAVHLRGAGVLWQLALPCSGSCQLATPSVSPDGKRVYVGASDGTLYAVDRTGALLWTHATGGSITAAPSVDTTGVVYVASLSGKLLALNGRDEMVSRLLWEANLGAPLRVTPVLGANGAVIVGADDDALHSIGSHSTTCPAGLGCTTYGPDIAACAEDGILSPTFKTPPVCGPSDSCPPGGTCFALPGGINKACFVPCEP